LFKTIAKNIIMLDSVIYKETNAFRFTLKSIS